MTWRHAAVPAALVLALTVGGCRKKEPAAPVPAPLRTITTATGVEMVAVPAGEFVMGGEGDDDEKPAHRVRMSAFLMDRTEVTQTSYESLMGSNPSKFRGPDRPVESLKWLSALTYCNRRSQKEGLKPCYDLKTQACDFSADGYRLPTEAEWEYACRAGGSGEYCFGNHTAALDDWAWSKENSLGATHPVAQKKPNAWGLYDMHGNVAEWCQDCYSPQSYRQAVVDDPRGPASGEERVLRGGSWSSKAERCRSAARDGQSPGLADACFGYENYGFRCVRKAPPGEK
jgi:formylglycine-generating enzyme required for sulfatase activity